MIETKLKDNKNIDQDSIEQKNTCLEIDGGVFKKTFKINLESDNKKVEETISYLFIFVLLMIVLIIYFIFKH